MGSETKPIFLEGVGRGERDGQRLAVGLARVDERDVIGQGLGIDRPVEDHLAPGGHHGAAFGRRFQMGRQPGHFEGAEGGAEGILAGIGLGRGQQGLGRRVTVYSVAWAKPSLASKRSM